MIRSVLHLWLLSLLSIVGGLLAQPALRAEENPFKSAQVGDWVSYKTEVNLPNGQKTSTTIKQSVKAKDDKEVTLSLETQAGTMKLPPRDIKVRLDVPYDPINSLTQASKNAKAEKLEDGDETLEVDNKSLKCQWVKMKITVDVSGQKFESISKIWTSKDIPVGGLVKMETEVAGQKVVMILTGFGKKK